MFEKAIASLKGKIEAIKVEMDQLQESQKFNSIQHDELSTTSKDHNKEIKTLKKRTKSLQQKTTDDGLEFD